MLKTVTHFAQHKTTTQVQATLGSALPDWLADAAGLRVSGYEIHMGETRREAGCPPLLQLHKAGQAVDDRAISDDGGVRHLSPWPVRQRCLYPGAAQRPAPAQRAGAAGQRPEYARYKTRQFDRLAEAMREHIAIDKIYAIMRQHQEPLC